MKLSAIVLVATVLLAIGALAFPYLRSAVLRAVMLWRLRKDIRAAGYKCRRFYKNALSVRNRSPKYDMVVYNDDVLYAVKLWSAYFLSSELSLGRNGRVREQRTVREVFKVKEEQERGRLIKGLSLSVPKTRLPKKYTVGRRVEHVLLIYPSYKRIFYTDGEGGRITVLTAGDILFDKTICSPSSFLSEIIAAAASTTAEKTVDR